MYNHGVRGEVGPLREVMESTTIRNFNCKLVTPEAAADELGSKFCGVLVQLPGPVRLGSREEHAGGARPPSRLTQPEQGHECRKNGHHEQLKRFFTYLPQAARLGTSLPQGRRMRVSLGVCNHRMAQSQRQQAREQRW